MARLSQLASSPYRFAAKAGAADLEPFAALRGVPQRELVADVVVGGPRSTASSMSSSVASKFCWGRVFSAGRCR